MELIREHGNLTPQAINELGSPVPDHASRCSKLVKFGLLTRISRGLYGITDDGLCYLDEELDASTLEPVDDE
nr:type IV toxin-antitoxin system AbiEi family antitoxin domain-containing protein [Haloferax litoreum]